MATKTIDCEVVVIGAGGTGMIAAVRAAELTGKKVIVLEKAKKIGGATIFAHGIQIYDSTWQKNAGETINDPRDETGVFFDWLVTKGGAEEYFKISDEQMQSMTSLVMFRRLDKYKDHDDPTIGPGWMGSFIVDKMMECCKKLGIDVITQARAKKFIKDSSGKITGVIADRPDGELQVNFKACFISAGGFGRNDEKCKAQWPETFDNIPMMNLCPPSLTGDLHDAAEEAGACIDLSSSMVSSSNPIHHPYAHSILIMMMYPAMVTINLKGEIQSRFGGGGGAPAGAQGGAPGGAQGSAPGAASEAAAGGSTGGAQGGSPGSQGGAPGAAPGGAPGGGAPGGGTPGGMQKMEPYTFSISDQNIVEKAAAYAPTAVREKADVEIVKRWKEEIEFEIECDKKGQYGHHTKRADTLVELALQMNIDPAVFVANMEKYNKECEASNDSSKIPIVKPPFYAFFAQRFRQCTHGGIVVNSETMEMFDTKGNVMPGMFAGGDCTTYYTSADVEGSTVTRGPMAGSPGLFGNYIGRGGGGLPGIIKGKLAGESIAKYLSKI